MQTSSDPEAIHVSSTGGGYARDRLAREERKNIGMETETDDSVSSFAEFESRE